MSLSDDLQDLVAQPMLGTPVKYMTAVREMNIHDFHEPAEGGEKLISNMDSAINQLHHFYTERGLRLAEPPQVRIIVEVTACTEPDPDA